MRKMSASILIFIAGALVMMFLQRTLFHDGSAAKRNVLAILDRPLPQTPVADNPVVLAAARIEPSVVNVDTAGMKRENPDFLGRQSGYTFEGKGSGVIISSDGYIVTNNHVIEGASLIRVVTTKDQKFEARVVGADPESDLAVLKIEASNLPVAELGNSDLLKIGEDALAIGNPLGVGVTVTRGIISATDRKNLPVGDGRVIAQAVQTDAPIQKGNSGGALANIKGQLIGINTAIRSETGGNVGIGFAIPINVVRGVIRTLVEKGKKPGADKELPYIGITGVPLHPKRAAELKLEPGNGIIINVFALTPADNAGLKTGDIVLEVDGSKIGKIEDIRAQVSKHHPGEKVKLKLIDLEGKLQTVEIVVGHKPAGL